MELNTLQRKKKKRTISFSEFQKSYIITYKRTKRPKINLGKNNNSIFLVCTKGQLNPPTVENFRIKTKENVHFSRRILFYDFCIVLNKTFKFTAPKKVCRFSMLSLLSQLYIIPLLILFLYLLSQKVIRTQKGSLSLFLFLFLISGSLVGKLLQQQHSLLHTLE